MSLFWGFGLQRQTVKFREVKQINIIWIMYDPDETAVVCSEFKCVMNPMPEQELCSPIRRDIGTLYRFDGVMNLCISTPADKHMYYLPLECPLLTDAATSNWSLLSSSLNMSFSLYSLASWTFQHQISTSSFWWILTSWQEWWWVLYPMISRPDFLGDFSNHLSIKLVWKVSLELFVSGCFHVEIRLSLTSPMTIRGDCYWINYYQPWWFQ